MAEQKTKPTRASVSAYIAAIADEERREDCRALVESMRKITQCEPTMWGAGMVGFDRYHYKYASGHEGDSFITGFASRKGDLTVYLGCEIGERPELMARLGKYKAGKSCLYLKRLSDVDRKVLDQLIRRSVVQIKKKYG